MLGNKKSTLKSFSMRVIFVQYLFVFGAGAIVYVFGEPLMARYVVKGGLIAIFTYYIYAMFASKPNKGASANEMLGYIFVGWMLRLVSTVVLFGLIFMLVDLRHPGALFIGYSVAILALWVAPLMLIKEKRD